MDIRFGKTMSGERTFTICGMADFLAPEIVQGRGHGFPADWYDRAAIFKCFLNKRINSTSTLPVS